jgi:energy-converting hydrogenase Eha subunit B
VTALGSIGPNWLGSPQHFFGGIALALVIVIGARLLRLRPWVGFLLAVGITSAVEITVELVEYPLLYGDHLHATAYYDTLADMGNSLVGAVLGAAVGVSAVWLRGRRPNGDGD